MGCFEEITVIEIYTYNAGKGDCIRIRYGTSCIHNIFIDSGVIGFGRNFAQICKVTGESLDALILVYNAVNALRQQLPQGVRIHGIITHGGDAPNIIPEYAAAKFYIRAASAPVLDSVYRKVEKIVEGAALATGCKGSMKPYQNRVENLVPTPSFDALYLQHLKEFGQSADLSERKSVGSSDVRFRRTPPCSSTELFKMHNFSSKDREH